LHSAEREQRVLNPLGAQAISPCSDLFAQQKIPPGPDENTFVAHRTVSDDELATHAVAQRMLRPIQQKLGGVRGSICIEQRRYTALVGKAEVGETPDSARRNLEIKTEIFLDGSGSFYPSSNFS
jgi:hypothetical protein